MNLKFSMHIVFSFVVSSCFAFNQDMTQQEIRYNQEGIHTIRKIIFQKGVNDKNKSDQWFFIEGLRRFCQEKRIKEGDVIAKVPNPEFAETAAPLFIEKLLLCNHHFPTTALVSCTYTNDTKFCFRSMSPAMEKFIQEMIEKGKSVNNEKN